MFRPLMIALLAFFCCAADANAQSRKQIRVTGSSTIYPFATTVAEEFGRSTSFKAPVVEGIGSGSGIKQFCAGIGINYPDIATSSRQLKKSEWQECLQNGVRDIIEINVGLDGIVLANSKGASALHFSLRELYLAIAKRVPDLSKAADGSVLMDNPYKTWADINPDLPNTPILVLGPPPTSGTRDALSESAMELGCRQFPALAAIEISDPQTFRAYCHAVREDGAYIDSGENDNLIVQKLQSNIDAIGIFGFSFLYQNSDLLQPVAVDVGSLTIAPSYDTISKMSYPIYRRLYLYIKKAHIRVVPGIVEFTESFVSENAVGKFGYLTDRGLIPLRQQTLMRQLQVLNSLQTMTPPRS